MSLFTLSLAQQLKLGPLRLRNGSTTHNGRLEVNNNGVWGTVCDDGFGLAEAKVACRELGIPTYVVYFVSLGYCHLLCLSLCM